MFGSLAKSMFREIEGIVWDLQTGRLGIMEDDIIYSFVQDGGKKARVTKNPIKEFAVPIPAYAIMTPIESLKTGDIIVTDDDEWVFFQSSTPATDDHEITFKGLTYNTGKVTTTTAVTNTLLGTKGVLAVKNLFATDNKDMANMLPMLLMAGSDGKDVGSMIAMMTLAGNKAEKPADGSMDIMSLLPMLLMKKKGGKMNPMALMMLMQGGTLGGGGGGMASLLPFLLLGNDDEDEEDDD